MTVAELITQLQHFDPNATVSVWDFGEGGIVEANEISHDDGGVVIEYKHVYEDEPNPYEAYTDEALMVHLDWDSRAAEVWAKRHPVL
jgi:hypothetical protein